MPSPWQRDYVLEWKEDMESTTRAVENAGKDLSDFLKQLFGESMMSVFDKHNVVCYGSVPVVLATAATGIVDLDAPNVINWLKKCDIDFGVCDEGDMIKVVQYLLLEYTNKSGFVNNLKINESFGSVALEFQVPCERPGFPSVMPVQVTLLNQKTPDELFKTSDFTHSQCYFSKGAYHYAPEWRRFIATGESKSLKPVVAERYLRYRELFKLLVGECEGAKNEILTRSSSDYNAIENCATHDQYEKGKVPHTPTISLVAFEKDPSLVEKRAEQTFFSCDDFLRGCPVPGIGPFTPESERQAKTMIFHSHKLALVILEIMWTRYSSKPRSQHNRFHVWKSIFDGFMYTRFVVENDALKSRDYLDVTVGSVVMAFPPQTRGVISKLYNDKYLRDSREYEKKWNLKMKADVIMKCFQ